MAAKEQLFLAPVGQSSAIVSGVSFRSGSVAYHEHHASRQAEDFRCMLDLSVRTPLSASRGVYLISEHHHFQFGGHNVLQ